VVTDNKKETLAEASSQASDWAAESATWMSAVWQFTGFTFLGVAVGLFIDSTFDTKPYALAAGGLLGSGLGFYAFIRLSNRILAQSKSKKAQPTSMAPAAEPEKK
jgi:F0F1-type ATP synthase assembly protein I